MHRISHKDFACLLNILESINKIQSYPKNFETPDRFYQDTLFFDATMMNFIVIGEMVEKLSAELIAKTEDEIDWFIIKGFRN